LSARRRHGPRENRNLSHRRASQTGEDRSIEGREGLYKRFRESAPWIVAAVCEEFPMMRHAVAIDYVQ